MTQEQLHIWAAGLLDGEAHMRSMNNVRKADYPRIHIGMTHLATVEKMQSIFGKGKIISQHRRDRKGNEAWRWECNGEEAYEVLSVLMAGEEPLLFTKRREAEIMLILCDSTNPPPLEEKIRLRKELRFLNSRYVFDDNEDQDGAAGGVVV